MGSFDPIDPLKAALAVIGTIIWLVRLEGRVNSNEKRCDAMDTAVKTVSEAHGTLQLQISNELGSIKESLARLEERLAKH